MSVWLFTFNLMFINSIVALDKLSKDSEFVVPTGNIGKEETGNVLFNNRFY